jgi:hypothetical protein
MGRRARAVLASLACCAAGACLVRHALPDPAPPASTHETRRRSRPDGRVEREVVLLLRPDGRVERDGVEREFHADGRLAAERSFARDVATGLWRTWYPDGSLRSEVDFGPPGSCETRPSRHWHPGGQLSAAGTTRAGVREGPWTHYSPEGALRAAGAYRNGLRDGPWVLYDAHGRKQAEGSYSGGVRVGSWTSWDEQGEPRLCPSEEPAPEPERPPPPEVFHRRR